MASQTRLFADCNILLVNETLPIEFESLRIAPYQTTLSVDGTTARVDNDPFKMIDSKQLTTTYSSGNTTDNYTGFSIPLSRKYSIRFAIEDPYLIRTNYSATWIGDEALPSMAYITPYVLRYNSTDKSFKYIYNIAFENTLKFGIQQDAVLTARTYGSYNANSSVPFRYIPAYLELEIFLNAGDFIAFNGFFVTQQSGGVGSGNFYKFGVLGLPNPFQPNQPHSKVATFNFSIRQIED